MRPQRPQFFPTHTKNVKILRAPEMRNRSDGACASKRFSYGFSSAVKGDKTLSAVPV